MFVTSDIYDLKKIVGMRRPEWSEHLMGGVVVHAQRWPEAKVVASFYAELAEICGLTSDIEHVGYSKPGEQRRRLISPKSLVRLAEGRLRGAHDACGVLVEGAIPAESARSGGIWIGGEASANSEFELPRGATRADHDYGGMRAGFVFPLEGAGADKLETLFKLAVDLVDADYGFYFVRDDACLPIGYSWGGSPQLDYSPVALEESIDSRDWLLASDDPTFWTGPPRFRDLYQINLLSKRYCAAALSGGGSLGAWIHAEPGRGRLEGIGRDCWLWTLTDAEMVAVRPVLNEAGLLFSCRDRVYRDLPNGGRAGG